MELNNLLVNQEQNESIKNVGEDPKKDIITLEEVFATELSVGKYTFRIKKLKGAQLFNLVNRFSFSGARVDMSAEENDTSLELMKRVYENFGENFDFAMQHIEVSQNNGEYADLVIKGIYQVEEAETNVALMYKLLFFIYQAVMLFMQISQQQLEDMK